MKASQVVDQKFLTYFFHLKAINTMRIFSLVSIFCIYYATISACKAQGNKNIRLQIPTEPGYYVARDYINLQKGFNAKAQRGDYKLTINTSLSPAAIYGNLSNTGIPTNQSVFSTSNVVGTIAGEASVNIVGAATYTIPITLPIGTQGLQPSINIGYNAQAGNGLMGKAWDISGLSAIAKVRKSNYFHTNTTNISNLGYGFALDGARLISKMDNYGADGAIYGLEVENYSKIIQVENHFILHTKDGKTIEYGNTEDSRIGAEKDCFLWRINKVTDSNGNYIKFTYGQAAGESWIETIAYTGNEIAGIAPCNKIVFLYDTRADNNVYYGEFGSIAQTKILAGITIFTNNALFKNYTFNYAKDELNSWLAEIIENGSDGSRLNSTKIDWGNKPETTIAYTPSSKTHVGEVAENIVGDFNGDGQTDYLTVSRGYLKYKLLHSQDPSYNIQTDDTWKLYQNDIQIASGTLVAGLIVQSLNAIDTDKDGKTELLYHWELNGMVRINVYEFNNVSFAPKPNTNAFSINDEILGSGTNVIVGNFDGNDSPDYIVYNDNAIIRAVNFSFVPQQYLQTFNAPLKAIDFNGDGKTELMAIFQNYAIIINITQEGFSQPFTAPSSVINVNSNAYNPLVSHFMGDFNGDGLVDILQYSPNKGNPVWNMMLFNGKAFNDPILVNLPNFNTTDHNTEVIINDYNEDGKADILVLYQNNELNTYVYLSQNGLRFQLASANKTTSVKGDLTPENCSSVDYNNDGKIDIMIETNIYATPMVFTYQAYSNTMVVDKITDGLNNTIEFRYCKLLDSGKYKRSKSPVQDITYLRGGPMQVLGALIKPDGLGGKVTTSYTYQNLAIHTLKGESCFEKITAKNNVSNQASSTMHTLEPFLLQTGISTPTYNSTIVKKISKTGLVYRITEEVEIKQHYSNNSTTKSEVIYDLYGNPITTTLSNFGGLSELGNATSTDLTRLENFVNGKAWLPYLPQKITCYKTNSNGESATLVTQMSYDPNGNMQSKIAYYGLPKAITTNYSNRNAFGIALTVTTSAANVETKTVQHEYDKTGRFKTKTINPLQQSTSNEYNSQGCLTISRDIDGSQTRNQYNGFGLLTAANTPTGFVKKITDWTNNNPLGSIYRVVTQIEGMADKVDYFDLLGRKIKASVGAVNNKTFITETVYNADGSIQKESKPYFQNEIPIWTEYLSYDSFYRPTQIKIAGLLSYSNYGPNNTHTFTDPKGNTIVSQYNELGQKISVKDIMGNTTTFTYDVFGNQKTAGTNSLAYDIYGNKISLSDPNIGTTIYDYDAYGRLISQTDAEGIQYSTSYDALDRIISHTNPTDITVNQYVRAGNGMGQIESIINSATGNKQLFTYDARGNLTSLKEISEGQTFETQYKNYNKDGSVGQIVYPSGFTINHTYSNGFLNTIQSADNKTLWKQGEVTGSESNYSVGNTVNIQHLYDASNGALRTISASKGQSKLFDCSYVFEKETGNLLSRKDNIRQKTDLFQYDKGNQLKSNISTEINLIDYAPNGNITKSSLMGTPFNYTYDVNKKNQVNKIDNIQNFQALPQNLKFNKFNMVAEIVEGSNAYTFNYSPAHERVKMSYTNAVNASLNFIRYYATGYEKEIKGTNTKETHYIAGPKGNLAIYITTNGTNGKLYYLVHDHLGSIVQILNEEGTIVEEQSFDAWGRRRNPTTWSYLGVVPSSITARGYTGHEHLDNVGLINMNGRLYDPLIGRMLSADPFVQLPDNSLSYNRYAYCLNNPLKYTDPSGKLFLIPIVAFIFFTDAGYNLQKYISPVALKIDWHYGTTQRGLGYDVSVGMPKLLSFGQNSYRWSYGQTYYTRTYGNYKGWETREGKESSTWLGLYSTEKIRFTMSTGEGEFNQTIGYRNYGIRGFMSFELSNDMSADCYDGDGNDRWRTAAGKVTLGNFEMGLNLFTGDPGEPGPNGDLGKRALNKKIGPNGTYAQGPYGDPDKYRSGVLYIGVPGYKIGINSEKIRNFFQNTMVHDQKGIPRFQVTETCDKLYFQIGSGGIW